jgi:hypothetical protein
LAANVGAGLLLISKSTKAQSTISAEQTINEWQQRVLAKKPLSLADRALGRANALLYHPEDAASREVVDWQDKHGIHFTEEEMAVAYDTWKKYCLLHADDSRCQEILKNLERLGQSTQAEPKPTKEQAEAKPTKEQAERLQALGVGSNLTRGDHARLRAFALLHPKDARSLKILEVQKELGLNLTEEEIADAFAVIRQYAEAHPEKPTSQQTLEALKALNR